MLLMLEVFMGSQAKKIIVLSGFFIAVIAICLMPVMVQEAVAKPHVIAVVNGKIITEKDISRDQDIYQKLFIAKNGRKPSSKELSAVINKEMQENLSFHIKDILGISFFNELGIKATDKEVRETTESFHPGLKEDPEKYLSLYRSDLSSFTLPFLEARKHPEKEREIYNLKMKDKMSYKEWKAKLEYFSMDVLVLRMESLPETVEDIYRSNAFMLKSTVLTRKFKQRFIKDITISDEEIQSYYEWMFREKNMDPPSDIEKERIRKKLVDKKLNRKLAKMAEKSRKKAKIEVKDARFKDVLLQFHSKP